MPDKKLVAVVEKTTPPAPIYTRKVEVKGEPFTFAVFPDEGYTLIDAKGKHVPAPGVLVPDEIESHRYAARKQKPAQ